MNNAVHPKPTGGSHWLTYQPAYTYCFLPSFEADRGTVQAYDYLPDFLLDFFFVPRFTMSFLKTEYLKLLIRGQTMGI